MYGKTPEDINTILAEEELEQFEDIGLPDDGNVY